MLDTPRRMGDVHATTTQSRGGSVQSTWVGIQVPLTNEMIHLLICIQLEALDNVLTHLLKRSEGWAYVLQTISCPSASCRICNNAMNEAESYANWLFACVLLLGSGRGSFSYGWCGLYS